MASHVANREARAASTAAPGPYSASAGGWPTSATASRIDIVRSVRNDPARVHTADEGTLSAWREFLNRADYACHYVAPEFFDEKRFATQDPFAVLVWQGDRIVAVASGMLDGRTVQCGLSSRPQLSIDPGADRSLLA